MSEWDGRSWPFGKPATFFVGVTMGAFFTTAIALAVIMWVASPAGIERRPMGAASQAADGEALATAQGCTSCHSTDGSVLTGPSWAGLAGSVRTLADGSDVTADSEYLRQSILDPRSQIVDGYPAAVMPRYGNTLSIGEVNQIVTYIQSLAG